MALKGIEHIGFVVKDAHKAAQWYNLHLGFNVLKTAPDNSAAFIQCRDNHLIIELISEGAVKAAAEDLTHPLQAHIAFRTDAFDEDMDALIEAGAEHAMDCETADPEAKVCILKDPFGLYIQLAQRKQEFYS